MNILFLASTFPRFKGDAQSPFVYEQILYWSKIFPNDKITVLLPDSELYPNIEIPKVKVLWFKYFFYKKWQKLVYPAIVPNIKKNKLLFLLIPFFLISQFINTLLLSKKNNYSVIYAHWIFPQGFTVFLVSKILNKEYVVHNHSTDAEIILKIPIVGKYLLSSILNNAKKVFCVNQYQKEMLSTYCRVKNKIKVYPMGIIPPSSPPNTKKMQFDFGFLGRLTEKKGLMEVLTAIGRDNYLKNKKIIIAGEGEIKDNLLSIVKDNKLKVKFLGFVYGRKKENFFQQFRVLLHPSIKLANDKEGLPVSILEGLSRNKVILTTKSTNIETFDLWDKIKSNIVFTKMDNSKLLMKSLKTSLKIKPKDIYKLGYLKMYYWNNYIARFRKEVVE